MKTHDVAFQGDYKITLAAMRLAGKHADVKPEVIFIYLGQLFFMFVAVFGGAELCIRIRQISGLPPIPESPFLLPIVGLAASLVYYLVLFWPYHLWARHSVQGALARDVGISLTPLGVRLTGGQSSWFTAWGDVDHVIKGKNFFGIVTGVIVIPIPFSAFATDAALQEALADSDRWHRAARQT